MTVLYVFNLLAPEFYIKILAHSVCKMWITQKPKKVALWNKWHFEEKKRRVCSLFKILSTYICWREYIKCNIWWVAVRPCYIYDARFLKVNLTSSINLLLPFANLSFFSVNTNFFLYKSTVRTSQGHSELEGSTPFSEMVRCFIKKKIVAPLLWESYKTH
jgi:hypothetical protein